MKQIEELIREHTKQIDQHTEELKKGTTRFKEINKRTKKIREEQKKLNEKITELQTSIGEKRISNGHTAKEILELKEANKSVHQKLDDIIEVVGYVKGVEDIKKEVYTRNQKIISLLLATVAVILTAIGLFIL
jgi:chromosome segregation ATPase